MHETNRGSTAGAVERVKNLELAFELININGSGDFEGEKDNILIRKAEEVLEIKFPPSYKGFLSKLGSGDIEGMEFFGLINENFESSSIPDAVWITLEQRKLGLPKSLVIIYATGDGTYFAIDTSKTTMNGENPIVSYSVNGQIEKLFEDYGSFLLSELKTVI